MPSRSPANHPRKEPTHPSTQHPGDDAMPPYTPGGVPEPATDEKVNPDHAKPAYPPKMRP
ncbi:hypothetical protein [Indioceanicola profundi]|uniref:hypothetical protein n=1 Tax=Indioceanicola profundi TaxID=2220096 RepID=UPI000E6AC7B9|nr:hypothetical protein [Indioceanicola profundi]